MAAATATLVAAPSLGAAPELDERFHPYAFTAQFGANPLAITREVIATVPDFLAEGNFRPGARLFEWSGHVIAGQGVRVFGLPLNLGLGVLRLIAVAVLAAALVRLVERCLGTETTPVDPNLLATATFFVGASFLVSSVGGPVNLFAWLYLGTAAIATIASSRFAHTPWFEPDTPVPQRSLVGMAALGAVLAGTNEMTVLALPLSAAVILARCVVLGRRIDLGLLRLPVARVYAALVTGFAVVFVPVRVLIAGECSDGSCYSDSDAVLTEAYPATVVGRIASGLLPPQWRVGSNDPALDAIREGHIVVVAVLFAVLVLPILVVVRRCWTPPQSSADTRQVRALAILGTGLLLAPTLVFSTSRSLQDPSLRVGEPWRDSALATPGAALLTAAVAVLVVRALPLTPGAGRLVLGTCGLGVVFMSFVTTWSVGVESRSDPERIVNNQVALEAATFVDTPDGNRARCDLLDYWEDVNHDAANPGRTEEVRAALDAFVAYAHGADGFCVSTDP